MTYLSRNLKNVASPVAIGAALLLALPAAAQQSSEEPLIQPLPDVSPDLPAPLDDETLRERVEGELPPPSDPPIPDDAAARQSHLDALFMRLANPDAPDWERIQAQIWAAWNRSGSDSMDLLATRADKAMEAKDLDTALLHLNDLVRLAPEFAEGWNKRATLHFMRDEYGASLEDIARTLKLEPRHFGALSGLGIILDRVGDKKGALEAYRRATELHPNLPGAQDGIKKLTREVEGERL